jgi:hypothetical protein
MQAGANYQNRVAAWVSSRILAEQDVSPPWDLPHSVTLEYIQCETGNPVDDLLVGTSDNGRIFIQAKHELDLGTRVNSDLASSIDQFVRQFLAFREAGSGKRPAERSLEAEHDRLVLVTSSGSSGPIQKGLPNLLSRVRLLTSAQTISDAAPTAQDRRILDVVVTHLKRAWQHAAGTEPSDRDLREILRLIRIHTLDVDDGEAGEREAKDILSSIVLHDRNQAPAAWSLLVQACATYASKRSGADRAALRQLLISAGINPKAPRSYRVDIERLQHYSQSTAAALSEFSKIRVGATEVKILRPSTQALRDAAMAESLVVVGEPGAGKSGALYNLAGILQGEGCDVVFFAADRLEAGSLGIFRNEIGLAHELDDVLKNWPGAKPGFLIIDALDAARSEASAQTLRELIASALRNPNRWRVVASIRKYDLRHNSRLRLLFSGQPPTAYCSGEFASTRHVNVPLLTDDELTQIAAQSQELTNLIETAGGALYGLLKVPFNLRLMGELLGEGVSVESLTPIRTQIELLDRYWQERVIRSDDHGDAREAVLRRAAERMVETRSLRVNRADISSDPALSHALNDVLSAHVLSEWEPSPNAVADRYVLTFSHHLLFDYAVSRLLLRGVSLPLVARLEQDPDLVLAIRPSIVFHFQHEWSSNPDRSFFWDLVFRIIHSEVIPEIGKLIGPSVAAEFISEISDVELLVRRLNDADPEVCAAAEQALRHLVRALLSAPSDPRRPLIGVGAPPWCELLELCSRTMRPPIAYASRSLISTMCDRPEAFTSDQRQLAGAVARRLLEFAWAQSVRDQYLVIHGLQVVCRTFESDPVASATLLRRSLESGHLADYGFEEMPTLAGEVKRLISADPELVEDIYRTAFGYQERSETITPIGGSRIMQLSSTRRQDYQRSNWALARSYPEFLERAPLHAIRALIAVTDAYVAARHTTDPYEAIDERFDFDGCEAVIRADNSFIWDEGGVYDNDDPVQMLNAFSSHLQQLAQDPSRSEGRKQVIDSIVTHNRQAVVWRRLLICGAAAPETLGREIRYLAWALPVLTGYDTTSEAGNLLKVIFGGLSLSERVRVERAILTIPDSTEVADRERAVRARNRLLGCLPSEAVATDEAKVVLRQLEDQGGAPPNEPLHRFGGVTWVPYEDTDYLANQGVPVDAEPNRRLHSLTQPAKEFAAKHINSSPTGDEIQAIYPALRSLRDAVIAADAEGVHLKQRDLAWSYLVGACEVITKWDALSCETTVGAFVKEVLLEAADHPDPAHQPERDAQFDDHPTWDSPVPRIDAAQGITWIARHQSCADRPVLDCIVRLSRDPAPEVRYQVAVRLTALYRTAPDLMWSLIERMSWEETSRGVLQGLLGKLLYRLANPHTDRVVEFVKIIFDRVTEGSGAKEVRRICVSMFAGLHLWRNQPVCGEIVFEIARNPSAFADESLNIVADIRQVLTQGPVDPTDPEQDAIRNRAFTLIGHILRSAADHLRLLDATHQNTPFNSWPVDAQEKAKHLALIADSIGMEIYFASGAFNNKQNGEPIAEPARDTQKRRRFLHEAGPILDDLADMGLPSLVHYLLETLEYLADIDPKSVFLRIGRVVRAGKRGGYQYESLAADLIVTIVERYLAEYRHVLRDSVECQRVLIEILDTFVQAGWPSAQRLAYRIEEIFR